jgi:ribonuclease HIII
VKEKKNFSYLSKDYYSFIVKRELVINNNIKSRLDYSYLSLQNDLYNKSFNSGELLETVFHKFHNNKDDIIEETSEVINIDNFKETKSSLTNSDEFLEKYEWVI